MEQKAKFIIVGLVGLLIICLFLFIQTLNSKQQLMRERDDLKNENASLSSKAEKLNVGLREKENEASLLRKDLEKVNRNLIEAQSKLELATRVRDKLAEELKSPRAGTVRPAAAQVEAAPPTTDAYWAGILKAKTDLEMQLEDLGGELKSAQINNEQLQRDKSALELSLNNLRRENDDIKRQLEYNKKVMDSLAQELVREKNDKIQIQDSFKSIKNENVIIVRQLRSLNMRKGDLDKKIKQLVEEKASLERKLSEMETVFTGKISQISELREQLEVIRTGAKIETPLQGKDSVELPPIVVRPQLETQIQEPADFLGKVLTVDRENNFSIIDLGEEAGVKIGDTFGVYREGKKIANIEVIKIGKSVAACDIAQETAPIEIGDTIK